MSGAAVSQRPAEQRPPRNRTDMTQRTGESWRPPTFTEPGRSNPWVERAHRFLNLQAGSVWRDLAAELPDVRGDVLDVGCGAQPYRELLHNSVRYRGIDTADAQANFGYTVPDTTYFSGNVWPVADSSVDFLMATETLEHVTEPAKFLSEASRCVRPGGTILLTVPFAARWHYIPHDYWRYTPSSLAALLKTAVFVEIAVYARGNAVTVACYKVMAIILPMLLPQGRDFAKTWLLRLLALPLLPLLALLAVIANISLLGRGGDDCLGYTVLARRAGPRALGEQ